MTSWSVGAATLTAVVESETVGIPPEFFFPAATAAAVARHDWLVPDHAAADRTIGLRVQALVVEVGARVVLVDPCVGDGKVRALPFWPEQVGGGLAALAAAGVTPDRVDTVVHTHLHADHVGWDTHRDGDTWVPTLRRTPTWATASASPRPPATPRATRRCGSSPREPGR